MPHRVNHGRPNSELAQRERGRERAQTHTPAHPAPAPPPRLLYTHGYRSTRGPAKSRRPALHGATGGRHGECGAIGSITAGALLAGANDYDLRAASYGCALLSPLPYPSTREVSALRPRARSLPPP